MSAYWARLVLYGSNFDLFMGFLPPQQTKPNPNCARSGQTGVAIQSNATADAITQTPNASFRGGFTIARQPHA